MVRLSLRQRDAQILYLALLHRAAGPHPSIDHRSGEPHANDFFSALRTTIQKELVRAVAEIDVPDEEISPLGEALSGAINELKQIAMTNGHSMVPGFSEAAQRLFPEIVEEPSAALDVVGHGVILRRRLAATVTNTETNPSPAHVSDAPSGQKTQQPSLRWWRLWRR